MARKIPLHEEISHCSLCADQLPNPPLPIFQLNPDARILIIGQAPGRITRERGRPWDDASGDRLRRWLNVDRTQFYESSLFGIVPMGMCYPGKGRSGDLPPRPECAPQWHAQILAAMPGIQLTLLIGRYAQDYYLNNRLPITTRVQQQSPADPVLSLPHPSPRNNIWLKNNPWFERELIPLLQQRISLLSEATSS